MKAFFFSASLLLLSLASYGQTPIVVEDSTTTTVPGIGGNAQIGYAFAKGDVVTIDAKASKPLQRMMVYRFPEEVVGRVKFTKKPSLTFTMPEDGIIIFRFISDRDGTNIISYKVTRTPASEAVAHYNTRVNWQPSSGRSGLIPVRVEGD
jgi:transcriptional regulator of nitric oxide reductase